MRLALSTGCLKRAPRQLVVYADTTVLLRESSNQLEKGPGASSVYKEAWSSPFHW